MNPSEAAQLLAHCAAFDNRTVGTADARAWAAALHNVPFDEDATAAVARFYGTPAEKPGERLWIQPHNVRAHRHAIRKERVDNFAYDGDPNETPQQYLARYRSQLAATAAGQLAAPTTAPALTGDPHPSVAKQLEAIGRTVPGDDPEKEPPRRKGPLGIECPTCRAPIGHRCKVRIPGSGERRPRELKNPHSARTRVANGGPAQLESPEEIEARRQTSLARLAALAAAEEAAQ